jgi:hypothetical protein
LPLAFCLAITTIFNAHLLIFSFNARDFYQIHTTLLEQGLSHAGIILAPQQRYGIGELMRGVLRLINTKSTQGMQGQIEFLSNWVY